MSSFFLQKPLFARVFIYFLTITGFTVILKWSPWSLFCFTPLYHLTKGLWGVHFEPRGVHLLIIPRQRKKPEQLRSDLDFCAVLENKCDLSILVNNGLFNHNRPDGVVPVMHHFRLFLEGTDNTRRSVRSVRHCTPLNCPHLTLRSVRSVWAVPVSVHTLTLTLNKVEHRTNGFL